jgi:hypothetical protein
MPIGPLGRDPIRISAGWVIGICFWLITGVVGAAAGAEGWNGLSEGASFLCVVTLVGSGFVWMLKDISKNKKV